MKIIYSIGNRIGAGEFLYRFLQHADPNWQIKIAGYSNSASKIKNIDWTLDSLNYDEEALVYGYKNRNWVTQSEILIKKLKNDIINWAPELIICDFEPVVANIANSLDIPLWYCSPLHLSDGIKKINSNRSVFHKTFKSLEVIRKFPIANRTLIYSYLGNIVNGPEIKPGFEWVSPYYLKSSNINKTNIISIADNKRAIKLGRLLISLKNDISFFSNLDFNFKYIKNEKYEDVLGTEGLYFTDGATDMLADAIYNNKNIIISPTCNDIESSLNAFFIPNIGINVGQVELMKKYAKDYINIDFKSNYKLNNINYPKLDELIKELE